MVNTLHCVVFRNLKILRYTKTSVPKYKSNNTINSKTQQAGMLCEDRKNSTA